MKLQYLGDARDAFKWDLLHWLCTQSNPRFSELVYVPLLTEDDAKGNDGKTPHRWFPCRTDIREFTEGFLKSRNLGRIGTLGSLPKHPTFGVHIFKETVYVPAGPARSSYWTGLALPGNEIIFLDPDNGFETATRKGRKWVRVSEIQTILASAPPSTAVVVYQHRPLFRRWDDVFPLLISGLTQTAQISVVYEASLAFIILAQSADARSRVFEAAARYAEAHGGRVKYGGLG